VGAATIGAQFDRAKVKNRWSYTYVPPTRLHGVDRDTFTFTYRILVGMLQIIRPLRKPSRKNNYLKNTNFSKLVFDILLTVYHYVSQ
jgi:hypothetical protein